ncbi:unnamed protein product [Pleuronectes platessa]|uniref:Uncharacterized protein n=1 Tax=Pleuronectes platessa TaxID=8262 RepID=A0A9N7YNV8_PLEPL|nr:unnamed protein product [Pleuronectes platessa]
MEYGKDLAGDFYQYYKYYHFYAICVGLGCGVAFYRPFRLFEIVGIISDLPTQTKRCKGPPYDKRDVCWGFCFALFMAILNLNSYHVYTLSYGCGIIVFALRGAKRKYSSLWKLREGEQSW